jgi:hypothetical protein
VAIAECANDKQDVTDAECQTDATLIAGGYLPAGFTIANAKTEYMSAVPKAAGHTITLVGTAEVGGCTITMTPTATTEAVIWDIVASGSNCGKSNTGFDIAAGT